MLDIHALGPVNLDSTRQEFANHIELIRTICSQFETEVLGDVMKMGAGADPAFRKHFTHLREQATLESTVTRTKDTLKMTKECLEEVTGEYDASQSKVQTQKLEKLGQSMGYLRHGAFVGKKSSHVVHLGLLPLLIPQRRMECQRRLLLWEEML